MFRRYGYAWLTLLFFFVTVGLHWYFGWNSFVQESQAHGQAADPAEFVNVTLRDTFENWQSEFLQLLWQVVGLAYFLYLGSPASKENDDRAEEKLDAIIRMIGGEKAEEIIHGIDWEYERRGGHPMPHSHGPDLIHKLARDFGDRR